MKIFLKVGSWRFLVFSLILLGPFCLSIQAAQAEASFRVCKNGVIYYYFSHRNQTKHGKNNTLRQPNSGTKIDSSCPQVEPTILEASRQYSIPSSLIKAVIRVESNFNPAATSPKGAQGLMQLMPGTASCLQLVNPYDVQENIGGGTKYLKMLLEKYNYNLPLALAAYNAGPQRVDQCQAVPSIKETQDFVRRVCDQFLRYAKE